MAENIKQIKRLPKLDKVFNTLFGETEQHQSAREMEFIFGQIHDLRIHQGRMPPFIRLYNRIATEAHPTNDATTYNTMLLSTNPLVDTASKTRTYFAWVDKLHTFIGVTFNSQNVGQIALEKELINIINSFVNDKTKPNIWKKPQFTFPVHGNSADGEEITIQEAQMIEFLKSIEEKFDYDDPNDIEHHKLVIDTVSKLKPEPLGTVVKTGEWAEVGAAM